MNISLHDTSNGHPLTRLAIAVAYTAGAYATAAGIAATALVLAGRLGPTEPAAWLLHGALVGPVIMSLAWDGLLQTQDLRLDLLPEHL